MKSKAIVILLVLLTTVVPANAESLNNLFLVADDDEGTFLGSFEDNEYSSNSIFNELGRYGSNLSSTSIFNQLGKFGSELSSYSAFNKWATHPPIIVDSKGNSYGRLSINRNIEGVTDASYKLAKRLKVRWNIMNK